MERVSLCLLLKATNIELLGWINACLFWKRRVRLWRDHLIANKSSMLVLMNSLQSKQAMLADSARSNKQLAMKPTE